MNENKSFDIDSITDELYSRLEDIISDVLTDQVESAVTCAVQDAVQDTMAEALEEVFSNFDFVLGDGTVVKPKQRMKVFSPDKSKLLICYGGLRVDGSSLIIQTGMSCWESIAYYPSREEAIDALTRVKNAMEDGVASFDL